MLPSPNPPFHILLMLPLMMFIIERSSKILIETVSVQQVHLCLTAKMGPFGHQKEQIFQKSFHLTPNTLHHKHKDEISHYSQLSFTVLVNPWPTLVLNGRWSRSDSHALALRDNLQSGGWTAEWIMSCGFVWKYLQIN